MPKRYVVRHWLPHGGVDVEIGDRSLAEEWFHEREVRRAEEVGYFEKWWTTAIRQKSPEGVSKAGIVLYVEEESSAKAPDVPIESGEHQLHQPPS